MVSRSIITGFRDDEIAETVESLRKTLELYMEQDPRPKVEALPYLATPFNVVKESTH
jgi:hypothetical protein